jgi:TfoX/Sxy family transcriptional regulator of competence genes
MSERADHRVLRVAEPASSSGGPSDGLACNVRARPGRLHRRHVVELFGWVLLSASASSELDSGGGVVPFDEQVAERVRAALSGRAVREVKMFGGLAFMVDDRMLVCVSAGGSDLLVRIAPDSDAEHLQKPGAARAEMGKGRSMGPGWITVDRTALATEEDLGYWMAAALSFHAESSGTKRRTRARTR